MHMSQAWHMHATLTGFCPCVVTSLECAEGNGVPTKRPLSPSSALPPGTEAPHKLHRPNGVTQHAAPDFPHAHPHAQHANAMHSHPRAREAFPEARKDLLFNYIESPACGDEGQEAVLQCLLQIGVDVPKDEDGEYELDPSSVPAYALWHLDALCQRQSRGAYNPAH